MADKKPRSNEHVGKVALIIVGVVVAAIIYSAVVNSRKSSHPSVSSSGSASLTVIHSQSFCQVDAATAHITFVVAVRNKGTAKASTGFRPWRRYNDGSINDGVGDDTVEFDVLAGATHVVNTTVPFDPTRHSPLACRVYFDHDGASEYFSIPVA